MSLTESHVEQAALDWFADAGYSVRYGTSLFEGNPANRASLAEVVLEPRLRAAVARLNPQVAESAQDAAIRTLLRRESPSLIVENRRFHRSLVDGVEVEQTDGSGQVRGVQVRLVDWDSPEANDWLAVNQFTITEAGHNRRPDIVLFLNGLPVAVVELKDPTDTDATIWTAWSQLQIYKAEIPSLFIFNEALVISDGIEARVGSLTAPQERFARWRTLETEALAPAGLPELQVLIQGLFHPARFLLFLRHFVLFEPDGDSFTKKLAQYHQFHAVNKALVSTVAASRPEGDQRAGVVWHTQGSGKSLTMLFYAGCLVLHPEMDNPTLVVLTDRNDLDDQLFGTFSGGIDLLRQKPEQAKDRAHLRRLLRVASGGVVFTTIHKFVPEQDVDARPLLSDRRNIVVIADEAHRSQYDFIDGFARHMRDALPNASFIGFTGTPVELTDANTRNVFGEHVSVYDIQRAVEDGATVPIYYEGHVIPTGLDEAQRRTLDETFEEITEGEDEATRESAKSEGTALEAVVGSKQRIERVAETVVRHFEQRLTAIEGKGMIVCMSRRICVALYDEIVKLRPDWHSDDDAHGSIKVVMTGSSDDGPAFEPHVRAKSRREALAQRFKNPDDPLRLVIVRDMWLTGFDAPALHTMYLDKPMRGHTLMQAIARVNRVFRDKKGGLVVDFLGLADQLRDALATYTESGGQGDASIDQSVAVRVFQEKYEVVAAMFHGFDYSPMLRPGLTEKQRLTLFAAALEHILAQPEGKERLLRNVTALSQAFSLAVPHPDVLALRDEVAFFQSVRAALVKRSATNSLRRSDEELDQAVRQIVSQALVSDEVVDIFTIAGLPKPDISILSDDFLAEVRNLQRRNLAVELLQRLLRDEVRAVSERNLVQSRSFSEMLERTLNAYQNRALQTAQVIDELIKLASEIRAARNRGEDLGLTDDEVAFYDALAANESAKQAMEDATLRLIAKELVQLLRREVTVDWKVRESVRARLRTHVKRLLRRHGYPPDESDRATTTIIEQAELLSDRWAA